ncbi:hypothetical protein CBS101457_006945 [Exobasidium rhododendri]|nr:hypothetical protein CBS101457_006945 [Exobasidium rhododendri]
MSSPPSHSLSPVWFVTGASRGLGRVIVEEVLEAGYLVVAACRNLSSVADLRKKYGSARLLTTVLDVSEPDHIEKSINAAVDAFGTIDVFVNNAGYSDLSSIEETSMESFRVQLETNLYGVIACTKAVLPLMRKRRKGHIIQISSVGGQLGPPGRGAYATAKWGIEGFSEVLAAEVKAFGLHVTIIEPGGFRTEFAAGLNSLSSIDVHPDYNSTVGRMIEFQSAYSGTQPGDPRKAAKALLHISKMDQPPLRVALGKDAYLAIKRRLEEKSEEMELVKSLSLSMAFEDVDKEGVRSGLSQ